MTPEDAMRLTLLLISTALLVAVSACKPKAPPTDQPPEPQAAGAATQAIRAPIDRAKTVEADLQKAAETQRKAIDAATGG